MPSFLTILSNQKIIPVINLQIYFFEIGKIDSQLTFMTQPLLWQFRKEFFLIFFFSMTFIVILENKIMPENIG